MTTVAVPGAWPVMVTPFREDRSVDLAAIDYLTDWYIDAGAAGLFAVCLSGEMYELTDDERLAVAQRVVQRSAGRVPVVASGTFGGPVEEQAAFVRRMGDTGVSAVVCIACQLAGEGEDDVTWRSRLSSLMDETGDIPLGLYECPAPYHRLISPDDVRWAASSGRFLFLKDTSCRIDLITSKIAACRGTPLVFLNAHMATILESLQAGGLGCCPVAANFYPSLFVWLCRHGLDHPQQAERLQAYAASAFRALRGYPGSAKRYIAMQGVPIGSTCRKGKLKFTDEDAKQLENLREEVLAWERELGIGEGEERE
ncbi:dihydrodipicolinate synthase family protein [Verrucomicrobiota bacterium]